MYDLNAAACAAGDSGVCARLPPFEKNYEACRTEARKPVRAEPAAATEAAAPLALKPTEAEGDPLVKEVQVLLAATGFDPGSADGKAGPATCAAAEAFAGNRKLAVGCADMVALRDALKRAL